MIVDPEFVSARINGVQVYSCYASPNQPLAGFTLFLQRLKNSIRTISRGAPILITGDFIARSAAWGDWTSNARGNELGLMLESLDLVIINTGSTPTFSRGAGSVIDLILTSESLAGRISNWSVMDQVFNNSDHHYIQFSISENLVHQSLPTADIPRGVPSTIHRRNRRRSSAHLAEICRLQNGLMEGPSSTHMMLSQERQPYDPG